MIPNFRGLDVEGYRIYRGRTDNPGELQLLAQFDYAPDPATGRGVFTDFRGLVNPMPRARRSSAVFIACDPALQPPPAAGHAVHRLHGGRPHRHAHPGHPGQPGAAGQRRGPAAAGRAGHGVQRHRPGPGRPGGELDLGQHRRAVRLHRPERAEQPAVLLLGHRVRRELAGVGSVEPGVGPGHQGGRPGRLRSPTTRPR